MSEKESQEKKGEVGPSLVLGLIGAVFVLILLAGAVWGVGKIISKVREDGDAQEEETVAEDQGKEGAEGNEGGTEDTQEGESEEEQQGEGDIDGDGESDSSEGSEEESEEEQPDGEDQEGEEATTEGGVVGRWVANNYKYGDIEGGSHTVVRGDTLWEIAEARYGSGFEWNKIKDVNFDIIGYLPNGSKALIIPGQVLTLP